MSDIGAEETFRRWHLPWKERVCEEARPFSHGTVFRNPRHPDYWEYNCIRLDRPMEADEMIAAADRELAGCAHRLVEWIVPMPDSVVGELRGRGWMATPLIFMLHDGRAVAEDHRELAEVDYDAVRELRDIWHREDFGEHTETADVPRQAREVAELADVRVIAAVEEGRRDRIRPGRDARRRQRGEPGVRAPGVPRRAARRPRSPRRPFASAPMPRRKSGSAPSAMTAHAGSTNDSASARSSRPARRSCRRSRNPYRICWAPR